MNLLGEVEGTSYDLVGSTRSIKLGIIAQLVVHSPTIVKGFNSKWWSGNLHLLYGFHHGLLKLSSTS
jgi:hypothetical protein